MLITEQQLLQIFPNAGHRAGFFVPGETMDLRTVRRSIVEPALLLLPAKMESPQAVVMLLAIGLQESLFEHRRQQGNEPARRFWVAACTACLRTAQARHVLPSFVPIRTSSRTIWPYGRRSSVMTCWPAPWRGCCCTPIRRVCRISATRRAPGICTCLPGGLAPIAVATLSSVPSCGRSGSPIMRRCWRY